MRLRTRLPTARTLVVRRRAYGPPLGQARTASQDDSDFQIDHLKIQENHPEGQDDHPKGLLRESS